MIWRHLLKQDLELVLLHKHHNLRDMLKIMLTASDMFHQVFHFISNGFRMLARLKKFYHRNVHTRDPRKYVIL